jgi:hypothetical protein
MNRGYVFVIVQGQWQALHSKGASVHVEESMYTYLTHFGGQNLSNREVKVVYFLW